MNQCVFCIETFFILRLFYEKKLHKIPVPPVVFFIQKKCRVVQYRNMYFLVFSKLFFSQFKLNYAKWK